MALMTVTFSPRWRLTVVPPVFATNAARSRSAPIRLLTRSFPITSSDGRVSPETGGVDAATAWLAFSSRGGGAGATTFCLALPFRVFCSGAAAGPDVPASSLAGRFARISRTGADGAGARRAWAGSRSSEELLIRSAGAATPGGLPGAGFSGARVGGDGCRTGGAGTSMSGGDIRGISGRVAGSVDAVCVGAGAWALGAEDTQ